MGQLFSIFFGTIAGVIKLGPFIAEELLWGKKIANYDPSSVELGAAVLKNNSEFQDGDFKDVYFDNAKDGCKLHAVMDTGRHRVKGKRPIVFVHGFPEMWISWMDQLNYYAKKGHPVLALDMRGYGLSDKPKSLFHYHMFNYILEDVRAAVHYLTKDTKETPLLVAHDWGASVCWAYVCQGKTTKDGEIVGYATLAIPPPEMFEAKMGLKQFWASLYIIFFNMPWLPEFIMLFNNAWLIGRMMNATKVAKLPAWVTSTYRTNCLQERAMTAQLNYYRYVVQKQPKPHSADVLGPKKDKQSGEMVAGRKLDLPILMIRGKDDGAITGDLFEGYEQYLTNARLLALDNCSHWIQADCPDRVNQELDKLLEQVDK